MSASQIFKKSIPNEVLIQLLESIAIKTDKCYIVNNNVYKKGIFNDDDDNYDDDDNDDDGDDDNDDNEDINVLPFQTQSIH